MAIDPNISAAQMGSAVRQRVAHHWVLFLIEGIALVILGIIALLAPELASLVATVFIGWILLVGGIIRLISTLRARRAPGFGWSLASAIIGIAAGVLLLGWPAKGTISLTAVLIVFFFLQGIVSVLYALEHQRALSGRWGWMLASGVLDIVLGVILLAGLPGSALWALGIIVGINLIFGGWALIVMALAARPRAGEVHP